MSKKWYVIQTYSGYENKVSEALQQRIKEHHMEDQFGEILIPTETVTEPRAGGKSRVRQKNSFPGYIFVEMEMSEEAWHLVKDTPKVTGFIGNQTPARGEAAADRRSAQGHRRRRGQAEAARLVRGGRRDPRHRRRVRELLRHGRRSEARQAEAQGQGLDLRPRHAGRARFRRSRSVEKSGARTPYEDQRNVTMKKITGTSSCSSPPARRTRRRPSVPRSASTASTSWRSARSSTPRPQGGDMIIPVVITVYSRPLASPSS